MKCKECQGIDFEYDEVMGETTCKLCGLIVITEIFEQTVRLQTNEEVMHSPDKGILGSNIKGYSKLANTQNRFVSKDGHLRKGVVFSQIVLSSLGVNETSLRDRAGILYRELHSKNIFSSTSLEVRGTAVAWFVLFENRTPVKLKAACEEFNCAGKSINRLIRKIKKHYGGNAKHMQPDPMFLLKKSANQISNDLVFVSQCLETLEFFESIVIQREYNKRNAYYESICWISKNIFVYPKVTLTSISEKTEVSRSAIQQQTKDLLGLIGLSTCAQVKGKQFSELGEKKYE